MSGDDPNGVSALLNELANQFVQDFARNAHVDKLATLANNLAVAGAMERMFRLGRGCGGAKRISP